MKGGERVNDKPTLLEVRVWADYACFTRPEMKVERVSYPVITPSAARGVLEAIFWKPEFSWRIHEVHVLQPIRHASFVRNEVNTRASERAARSWERDGGGFFAEDDRSQRHTLALRKVDYLIRAEQVVHSPNGDSRHPMKYREQFGRRVRKGQCFAQPYLGCREFSCAFAPPDGSERPEPISDDLGRMLFDLAYDEQGRGTPFFFSAHLDSGVLRVPQDLYEQIARRSA